MATQATMILTAGTLRVELNPSIGGSISAFEWIRDGCRLPILRKSNSAHQNVLEAASFPLVPYVNRIRGGRFTFRGRQVRLIPNMAGDPSPLHGQGWLNPWIVEESSDDRAALSYRHHAGEWPWDYAVRQEFALDERRLSIRLTCTNTSDGPMPCGLGQHPYFPCGAETRIDTAVAHAWTIDEHVLPVEKVPAEGRFDLRRRLVCGQDLDHGFDRWGGLVWMGDPNWPYELLLSSTSAGFFQLYSPLGGGIFVAEPVTHANAALNAPEQEWRELGMRVLEPGKAMSLDMHLEVVPK
jgi:aldose 1-epimerase